MRRSVEGAGGSWSLVQTWGGLCFVGPSFAELTETLRRLAIRSPKRAFPSSSCTSIRLLSNHFLLPQTVLFPQLLRVAARSALLARGELRERLEVLSLVGVGNRGRCHASFLLMLGGS